MSVVWKAVVDVPCNLQSVVINFQRVVEDVGLSCYTVRPQRLSILLKLITVPHSLTSVESHSRSRQMELLLQMLHEQIWSVFFMLGLVHTRWHVQDKTVLSCLFLSAVWTEVETGQNSFEIFFHRISKLFCLVWTSVHIADKTRQDSLALSPIPFTLPTRTRRDSLVLSVSAVWTGFHCQQRRIGGPQGSFRNRGTLVQYIKSCWSVWLNVRLSLFSWLPWNIAYWVSYLLLTVSPKSFFSIVSTSSYLFPSSAFLYLIWQPEAQPRLQSWWSSSSV